MIFIGSRRVWIFINRANDSFLIVVTSLLLLREHQTSVWLSHSFLKCLSPMVYLIVQSLQFSLIQYFRQYSLRKMLKKGENYLNNLNITKKSKLYTEPNQSYCDFNKENLGSKSLFEHVNDSNLHQHPSKQKAHEQSGCGSAMISPTFQSPDLVNLKDDRFRQEKSYLNINFSLKDMEKTSKDTSKPNHGKSTEAGQKVSQEKYVAEMREVEQLKKRLQEHYSKKKYWKKLEALFEQEGVDAVLAWEDAIEKYKAVKTSNQQLVQENNRLENEINVRDQRISHLEKQLMQDKNETRVLSHKKCKGCETLEQKEKDYFQLYEQNKKMSKQVEELKGAQNEANEQFRKVDQKYKNLIFLKQEVEKKNGKLLEKEKELTLQVQKLQKSLKEVKQDSSNSKELHIEIQQLKESKYQIDKTISKLEEKHKRQISDLKLQLSSIEEEKNILQSQSQKVRLELNESKSKLFKIQFQMESIDESLKIKTIECQELKKRHIENMSEEMRKKNGLDDSLKNKEEELKKAYHLMDQVQNVKLNLEMELNQERKASQCKDEELSKQLDTIKDLEDKIREMQEKQRETEDRLREMQDNQHRIKEVNQVYTMNRGKTTHASNYQGNLQVQSTSPQGSSLMLRISSKIKELHATITQLTQQNLDSYQKRRSREDMSEERQQINLLKTERYVNQLITEFYNFRNKFDFIQKDNQNLKMQLQNQTTYKQQEMDQLQREIDLKEQALRSLISWIPDELREVVVEFLCMTEQLSKDKCHEQLEYEEYDDLKHSLENQGKQWKENYDKVDRRLKKLEEELRRVEDQNQQLKRRMKLKDGKRPVQTEYDYREISKKDIRKKYNLDN